MFWNIIGRKDSCRQWMRILNCICEVCFKSGFEWKGIVSMPWAYPSVHRAVLAPGAIDSFYLCLLSWSLRLLKYLKLTSKYRTEVTEEPFILKAQLTEILTCFLSNLLQTWALVRLSSLRFSTSGEFFPLGFFSPASVVRAHRCHGCLRCLRTSLEVSHLPLLSHLMVKTCLLIKIKSNIQQCIFWFGRLLEGRMSQEDGGGIDIAQPYPGLFLVDPNTTAHRGRDKTITH